MLKSFAFCAFISLTVSSHATTTGLWLQGSPSSFVGLGKTYEVAPADGFLMTAEIQFNNALVFRAYGKSSIYGAGAPLATQPPGPYTPPTDSWWEIAVGVGNASLPQPGNYIDPSTSPNFADPYLAVTGNFRATNQTSGQFKILEVVYDANGQPTSLAVDFTEFEENNPKSSIVGSLRYNSSVALTVPEPSAQLLMAIGLLALLPKVRRVWSLRNVA